MNRGQTKLIMRDKFCGELLEFQRAYILREDEGSGFSFPCTEDGEVITEGMSDCALQNLHFARHSDDYKDNGVVTYRTTIFFCRCGSGKEPWVLYDARGIPTQKVCDQCVDHVKSKYRSDIFEDSQYWTYETIEEDY